MRLLFRWLLRLVVLVLPGALPASAQGYDVVIARGRVIDPESGLDAERWVGIRNGRIAALSTQPLRGARTIEAKGLVVAPGFIDLHQHGQDDENYRIAALDGVTTALELEVGAADVERWYRDRAHGQLIKYGVAIGHIPVRMAVLGDSGSFLPSGPAANREATPAEVAEMVRRLEAGLQQGAVAVGFGTAYTPAATRWEILDMFRVAARYGASCHIHIRDGVVGVEEAIAASALTAAPPHIVHINSVSHSDIGRMLQLVVDVRAHGVDVTTEAYPYTAGMTQIESALFDGWEKQPDAHFPTLEWVATGERLSRATFAEHRRQGGMVISHSNTEENVAVAIASPLSMIASDGLIHLGKGHPRSSGTYAKVLGHYVRETRQLTLMEAIRKMTLMPARRLERRVPSMRRKGRIRVGADADLTVFDSTRVADRSTYREPTTPPDGIVHVLVAGMPVVRDGSVVPDIAPGRAIRAPLRSSRQAHLTVGTPGRSP